MRIKVWGFWHSTKGIFKPQMRLVILLSGVDHSNRTSVYFGVINKILYLRTLKGGVYYDRS